MKVFLELLCLLSLISFSISCGRELQQEEEIRREKPIRQDDIREEDSYSQKGN